MAPHGQLVGYDDDRAARDLGLHLYERPSNVDSLLGHIRVWFQLKGIRATTLSAEDLRGVESVTVRDLRVDHLKYWFAHPEAVYLVAYVEAMDRFLVEDVRFLVESRGGLPWPEDLTSQTVSPQVGLDATLERALARMPRHRTLRLDGPDYKGRPLGHRLDPLRCELDVLDPKVFCDLVERLLAAHEFRPQRAIDPRLFIDGEIGSVTATLGRLYSTYEWTCPLMTEFGYGPDSDFRIESSSRQRGARAPALPAGSQGGLTTARGATGPDRRSIPTDKAAQGRQRLTVRLSVRLKPPDPLPFERMLIS